MKFVFIVLIFMGICGKISAMDSQETLRKICPSGEPRRCGRDQLSARRNNKWAAKPSPVRGKLEEQFEKEKENKKLKKKAEKNS